MSIDTAEKRRSAAGVKRVAARVTPNSSQDQEWRQQAGRIYSGILVGGAGPQPDVPVVPFVKGSAQKAVKGTAVSLMGELE